MSTRDNRRSMSVVNDTLRAENSTLKSKESEMIAHIETLIRREKQLVKLKQQLLEEAEKSKQLMIRERMMKQEKCIKLEAKIQQMNKSLTQISFTLKNLDQQYQLCLKDYDKALEEISSLLQTNKGIQLQLAQEIQKRSTIQAMIFDNQRLLRVLQEQRKYFRQLSANEEKSHAERMKEFQAIRQKLIQEEKQCFRKKYLDRCKIGLIKLKNVFATKFINYAETFIRGNFKFERLTSIGISKFRNCLEIATTRYHKQLKGAFKSWHNNVFPSSTLNNIVQNSLRINFQSKTKIRALNKIVQKLNADNLSLLHLYERTKIVCLAATTTKRKQTHLAFCRWRAQSAYLSLVKYRLEAIQKRLSLAFKRNAFGKMARNIYLLKRFEVASHLLSEYQNAKGLAWAMRKWRWQTQNHQISIIQHYVQNMKKFNMIQQRVKYEKRKVKALTILQLAMSKIQLRNYFSRYYQNVKAGKVAQVGAVTQELRDKCVKARKDNKSTRQFQKHKRTELSLTLLFNWMTRFLSKIGLQVLKASYELQTARKHALLTAVLKKQGKTKYYVMNEFRKNVQSYQKKQMHQVLTDLNNKMQAINQKSTAFRQALKKTIQELGVQSSKKMNEVFQYTFNSQQRVFFNQYLRKSIQKKFKEKIADRLVSILTSYAEKNAFRTVKNDSKETKKDKVLYQRERNYCNQKQSKLIKRAFYGILDQLKLHKRVFSKFIHVENVMYFYRLECGFLSIIKKAHQYTSKQQLRNIEQLSKNLRVKEQNLIALTNDKNILEQKLRSLFSKFVNFQQLSQNNKERAFLEEQKRKYFQTYRKKVQQKKYANEVLNNFAGLLQYKNYFIFWKSILLTLYENQQVAIKDELAKINKKRKTFDDKIFKTKTEIQQKLYQQQVTNQTKRTQGSYYLKKYQSILSYYDVKHQRLYEQKYAKAVFKVWKHESLGTRKFYIAIQKILHRTHMIEPYNLLFEEFRNFDKKYRSKLVCAKILEKKQKRWLSDGFNYWRYNMKHGYSDSLKYKVEHIDEHHEEIKNGIYSKADLYANEVIRKKYSTFKSIIFMAFKNNWNRTKQNANKIAPLINKIDYHRLFNGMRNWKWLMFYKKTKRTYLPYKKKNYQRALKKDVFNALKIHRDEIYHISDLIQNFVINRVYELKRFVMSKIINFASNQKNELIYKRRRTLNTLLMKKITHQKCIKRTVMWKWQSQLIPRKHYLCNILVSLEKRILKSAFANINQKKYWNQHYIKDTAQKVTTEGYAQVNSITNILVREGFDPDQLKDYLKSKSQKDDKIIKKVVGHIKTWPTKPNIVKAFHSWKQYVVLRKNIKNALSKVFNFSSGVGRYFNRWRKKDTAFNEILQRQSRVNMLERYKELERLMKEYKRDMKESLQNCQQLKGVNDEYAKSTKITVTMALSNMANSVHKGMRQGLQIWRTKAKHEKTIETNKRYDQIVDGIEMMADQKKRILQKIKSLEKENHQLKEKCKWGKECGDLLKKLIEQKDGITIDLAQKQHNLKILLEDNLRLKQKIKIAKDSALKLITKIRAEEGIPS